MDEVTNALIAGISAKVKLLAENAEARVGAVGESAAEDINEAVWTLAQAGQAAAEDAARRASRLTAWPAIILTVLLSATALCMAFIGGAYYGASGHATGSAPPNALAAWALTPAGHEAYALDKANAATGGIRMFTLCSMPGWRTLESHDRALCMPYPLDAYQAKYESWVLPRDPRPKPPKLP